MIGMPGLLAYFSSRLASEGHIEIGADHVMAHPLQVPGFDFPVHKLPFVVRGGDIEIGTASYPAGMPLERHRTLSEALLGEGEHPPYLPAEGEPVTLSQALDAGIFAIDRFRAEQKALYAD